MRPANMVSIIRDSDPESDSKELSSVFTNPPPIAGYELPFQFYSDPYPIFEVEGSNFLIPAKKYWKHDMIFHRAKDASTLSPPRNFVSEAKPNFKPFSWQSHNMIRNMYYNLKKTTRSGMTEGILVPYTGMTKKQADKFNWNHRIKESQSGIGYTPYQNIPHVIRNFRAKTAAYTNEYDSDDSLEKDMQDSTDWAIFQHLEGVSDDDGTTS
ncbi:hypothetical protein AAC387_Pa08g1067 [Persea americana]